MQSVVKPPTFDFRVDAKAGQYFKLGPDMSFEVVTPRAKTEKFPGLVGAIKRESIAVFVHNEVTRLEVKPEVLSGQARDGKPLMQSNELALNVAYNTSILRAFQHYARQHFFESDGRYLSIEMQLSKRGVLALPPADFAQALSAKLGNMGKVQGQMLGSAEHFEREIDKVLEKKAFTGPPDQVRALALGYLHRERRKLEQENIDEARRHQQLVVEGKASIHVDMRDKRDVSSELHQKIDQFVDDAIRDCAPLGHADSGDAKGASSASSSRAQKTFEEFRDDKLVRKQLAQLDGLRKVIADRLPPGAAVPREFEALEDSLGTSEFHSLFEPLETSVRQFHATALVTMAPYAAVLGQLPEAVIHDQVRYLGLSGSVKLPSNEVASMMDGFAKLTGQGVKLAEVQSRACAILLDRYFQQRMAAPVELSNSQCFKALALAVEQMLQERATPPAKEVLDYGAVSERRGCRIELKDGTLSVVGPKNAKVGIDKMERRYQYNAQGFYELPKDAPALTEAEIGRNRAANDPIVMALAKGLQKNGVPPDPYVTFFNAAKELTQLPPKVFASQVAYALKQVDEALAQSRLGARSPQIEFPSASSLTTSSSSLSSQRPGSPSSDLASSQSFASEASLEQSSQALRPPGPDQVVPSGTAAPVDSKLTSRTVEPLASRTPGPRHSRIPTPTIVPDVKAAHTSLRDAKAEALRPIVPTLLGALPRWTSLQQRLGAANKQIHFATVNPNTPGVKVMASAALPAGLIENMRKTAEGIGQSLASSDRASTVVQSCTEFSKLANPKNKDRAVPGVLHQLSVKIRTELAALALESGMTLEDLDAVMQSQLPLVPLADDQRELQVWGDTWGVHHEEMIEKTELSRRANLPAPPLSKEKLNALLEDARATRAALFPDNRSTPERLETVQDQLAQLEFMLTKPGAAEQSIEVFEQPIGLLAASLELALNAPGEAE